MTPAPAGRPVCGQGSSMTHKSLAVALYVDGGARGNPGPAAAGVVIRDVADGRILHEAGYFIGHATNNVAEYRGLLAGLEAAGRLGARRVVVYSDSQLLVRQMAGRYRVKNDALQVLHGQACELAAKFEQCTFEHVRREQNVEADRLVNQAMDLKRNIEDAADTQ